MRRMLTCIIGAVICAAGAAAQSADKVSQALSAPEATWGLASYFAVTARGGMDSISEEEALAVLMQEGYAASGAQAGEALTLEQASFILSAAWDIKGSLWLLLKAAPRYTLRQLKADGVVSQDSDPQGTISGRDLLNVMAKCMDAYAQKSGEAAE